MTGGVPDLLASAFPSLVPSSPGCVFIAWPNSTCTVTPLVDRGRFHDTLLCFYGECSRALQPCGRLHDAPNSPPYPSRLLLVAWPPAHRVDPFCRLRSDSPSAIRLSTSPAYRSSTFIYSTCIARLSIIANPSSTALLTSSDLSFAACTLCPSCHPYSSCYCSPCRTSDRNLSGPTSSMVSAELCSLTRGGPGSAFRAFTWPLSERMQLIMLTHPLKRTGYPRRRRRLCS